MTDQPHEFIPGAFRAEEAFNEETELCRVATDAVLAVDPDANIVLMIETDRKSAIQMSGFESTSAALAFILYNVKIIANSEGKDVAIIPVNLGGRS